MIFTSAIVSLSVRLIIGDTNASGLKVLSAEKSNPGFSIVTWLILPILVDSGMISTFTPSS